MAMAWLGATTADRVLNLGPLAHRALYDANEATLNWADASFLSREQQRRRDSGSTLPREHYELAVLRHTLTDPTVRGGKKFPAASSSPTVVPTPPNAANDAGITSPKSAPVSKNSPPNCTAATPRPPPPASSVRSRTCWGNATPPAISSGN